MTDKKEKEKEQDAPVPRKRTDTTQNGITLRLGPDSKLSLPIQGGNLVMMLVIAGQLFWKYADLPDNVEAIGEDIDKIQLDLESLKTQGTERDKSIGALETRVEILEDDRDELNVKVSDLETARAKAETKVADLEKENETLVTCVRRPSKCRL
jgi:hypothetical protein